MCPASSSSSSGDVDVVISSKWFASGDGERFWWADERFVVVGSPVPSSLDENGGFVLLLLLFLLDNDMGGKVGCSMPDMVSVACLNKLVAAAAMVPFLSPSVAAPGKRFLNIVVEVLMA